MPPGAIGDQAPSIGEARDLQVVDRAVVVDRLDGPPADARGPPPQIEALAHVAGPRRHPDDREAAVGVPVGADHGGLGPDAGVLRRAVLCVRRGPDDQKAFRQARPFDAGADGGEPVSVHREPGEAAVGIQGVRRNRDLVRGFPSHAREEGQSDGKPVAAVVKDRGQPAVGLHRGSVDQRVAIEAAHVGPLAHDGRHRRTGGVGLRRRGGGNLRLRGGRGRDFRLRGGWCGAFGLRSGRWRGWHDRRRCRGDLVAPTAAATSRHRGEQRRNTRTNDPARRGRALPHSGHGCLPLSGTACSWYAGIVPHTRAPAQRGNPDQRRKRPSGPTMDRSA